MTDQRLFDMVTLQPEPTAISIEPAAPTPTVTTSADPFRVEVRSSTRRKRTVGAQLIGDVLTVTIPSWMSVEETAHWVEVMSGRFRRKMNADRIDLDQRAASLADRHGLPRPSEIRWSDEMRSRWGSCTPSLGTIRISTRLAPFPDWVIDYVIVHELAHIRIGDHSPKFWELVNRYPQAERAIGFLIAKSGEEHD